MDIFFRTLYCHQSCIRNGVASCGWGNRVGSVQWQQSFWSSFFLFSVHGRGPARSHSQSAKVQVVADAIFCKGYAGENIDAAKNHHNRQGIRLTHYRLGRICYEILFAFVFCGRPPRVPQ